ncbi:PseG/SpsG family protein [Maridesulfovibrio hydrothermalis]|uniref:Acylneuraminate cytidylyltransferase n=1 Tax=Maridesulfovibrio hydrothermalis AM13 = DSM 14728 TaxID=1121451 RepID=L0RBI4_9BACT|nr:glycosyltransferase [Maridesulfovibrio hydrothermalis]CCO23587.1 Acylneuraminate cytidylyltransferase [Maridesulfovibrio hydrothermalis AM13 = DSM 14728]
MANKRHFLFFCEGSPERGLGHVGRCLALAVAVSGEHDCTCRFVFRGSAVARDKIISAGFEVTEVSDFNKWQFSDEDAAVLDLLVPLNASFFRRADTAGTLLCTLDDPTANRLRCALAFYPPVPQVIRLGWKGFGGELFCDWNFIPLRKEFSAKVSHIQNAPPRVLLTLGGSDPEEFTLRILNILKYISESWTAVIIAGPMFNNLDKIKEIAVELGDRVELLSNVNNIAELMSKSDLAVSSFGMTSYELAACGIPQLMICLSDDHARSASALHHAGAAVSLGKYDRVSDQDIITNLKELISNQLLRTGMSTKAARLGIGKGASNIASIIMHRLELRP